MKRIRTKFGPSATYLNISYKYLLTDMMAKFLFTKRLHSTVVKVTVDFLTTQSLFSDHCLPTTTTGIKYSNTRNKRTTKEVFKLTSFTEIKITDNRVRTRLNKSKILLIFDSKDKELGVHTHEHNRIV